MTNTIQYYDGTPKSPIIPVYDTSIFVEVPSSVNTAVDAGTYYIYLALVDPDNYKFTGVSQLKTVDGKSCALKRWTIKSTTSTLNLSDDEIQLTNSHSQTSVTITYTGDGTLSATSSNTETATVSLSGKTLTVKASGYCSETATIKVSATATANYGAASATLSVTSNYIPPLNNCSWQGVKALLQKGEAQDYWKVGDYKVFNSNGGTVTSTHGNVTTTTPFSNLCAKIIGFDHNPDVEGYNRIHFMLGVYDGATGCSPFYANTFYMGKTLAYEQTNFVKNLVDQFFNILPADLQNIIATTRKYYQSGIGSYESGVGVAKNLAINAKLFLFGADEVTGIPNIAAEELTEIYDYFANGNSRKMSVGWWLRDIERSDFCKFVTESGKIATTESWVGPYEYFDPDSGYPTSDSLDKGFLMGFSITV